MGIFDFFKKKTTGIIQHDFQSKQFQAEILAYAQAEYFENKQNYEIVRIKLLKQNLSNEQANEIVAKLQMLNANMVDDFTQKLDTGVITDIKITPNPSHTKGNVDAGQVDKYIGYGAYQMERGDLQNALELFDKAIELDDKATLAYANKGTLYSQMGDNEKAVAFYNKALEFEPDNIQILENKMDVFFNILNQSNETEFIDTVKSLLRHDSANPNARIYIIQFYLKENDIENAVKSVKMLFNDYPAEGISMQLLLNTFGRLPKHEALNEFEIFKSRISGAAKYQLDYCKGLYLKEMGDYDEAILVYEDLNKIRQFSWNYYQMAIIKNLQQNTNECLALLKDTFELEPALKDDAKQYPELQNLWTNTEFITITQ